MPIAEGIASRVAYKFYASGDMSTNTEEDLATAPGASGGQVLRRVSANINLQKETYQANEVRTDRQIADFRHGARMVSGSIAGELSPGTYKEFMEAVFRGTFEIVPTAITNVQATNLAMAAATGLCTFGSGNAITLGVRVGSMFSLGSTTLQDTNTVFTVVAVNSATTFTVRPLPVEQTADTTFTMTFVAKKLIMPSSSFAKRKALIEVWAEDLDIARLFTECRFNSMALNLPASNNANVTFGVMGRSMTVVSAGSAPYLTGPTAATTTPVLASPNGYLVVQGAVVGVVTDLNINAELATDSSPVVGQLFRPEIFLGRMNVTGSMTVYFEDAAFLNYFRNETDVSLVAVVRGPSNDLNAISIVLPRIKFGGADIQTQGEGGQLITMPFQALKYQGVTTTGMEQTTMTIFDGAA
jgi:hypothetical protein